MANFKLPESTINKMNSTQQMFWRNKQFNKGKHYIAFRHVNKPKEEGGLGVRDLEVFNRSLLAKSAWKLCADDTSICAKSLKAKYFQDGNLFNLQENSNSTWSWRSISSELHFIPKFSCWSVGDGKKVRIWYDRWIEELDTPPKPRNEALNYQDFTFVQQLVDNDTGSWNLNLVNHLFEGTTVNYILKISLHQNISDRLIWLLEKNGRFTVKSAYRQMIKEKIAHESVGVRMQNIFKKLWKLPVLPRVRQFIWKCTRNILPTREKLLNVIQDGDLTCPFCTQESETPAHCILNCSYSKLIWYEVLGLRTENVPVLQDWLCGWFDKLIVGQTEEKIICKIAIIAWCIWNARCDKAFNNSILPPELLIQKCKKEISEQVSLTTDSYHLVHSRSADTLHWTAPAKDFPKINIDGSYLHSDKTGGVGLIIRNFAGAHRGSKCIFLRSSSSAEHAESRALWEATQWAKERNLQQVVFEMDSKIVVDAVNNDNFSIDWRLMNLILEIKSFFSLFKSWQCVHVPKSKNKVADILSKLARVDRLCGVLLLSPPDEISAKVQEEANYVTDLS